MLKDWTSCEGQDNIKVGENAETALNCLVNNFINDQSSHRLIFDGLDGKPSKMLSYEGLDNMGFQEVKETAHHCFKDN